MKNYIIIAILPSIVLLVTIIEEKVWPIVKENKIMKIILKFLRTFYSVSTILISVTFKELNLWYLKRKRNKLIEKKQRLRLKKFDY